MAVADVSGTCTPSPPPHRAAQRRGLALLFLTPPHPLPQGRSWRISVLQLHATRLRSIGSERGPSGGGNRVVGEGGSCTGLERARQ
eukprot:scaffold108028_cov70-Phaeocystis_antarctica.AAC.2